MKLSCSFAMHALSIHLVGIGCVYLFHHCTKVTTRVPPLCCTDLVVIAYAPTDESNGASYHQYSRAKALSVTYKYAVQDSNPHQQGRNLSFCPVILTAYKMRFYSVFPLKVDA